MILSPALKNLLNAIGSREAPRGYGQIYGGAKLPRGTPTNVSIMPLAGVQALQAKMLANGSASTACGRYQFIRKTLAATIAEMGLTGKEIWTPDLQDRMAVHLMEKRGLNRFMTGQLSAEAFCNNLAMEWASLPVVTAINGKKPGQSYYAGDGLNKSFHSVASILALVGSLKSGGSFPPPPDVEPIPPAAPSYKPSIQQIMAGLIAAIAALVAAYFMKG